ncbi:MAG: hypothetical protein GY711_12945 [bacterium]|nr:hypothetical protein [bacterium]
MPQDQGPSRPFSSATSTARTYRPDPRDLANTIGRRLITTREGAAIVGVREEEFLRLMARLQVSSQYMVWHGKRRVAIRLPDLIRVAAATIAGMPRSVTSGPAARRAPIMQVDRSDEFEAELQRKQGTEAKQRIEQLERQLRLRNKEVESLTDDVAQARAERESSTARGNELVESRTLLNACRARLAANETMLHDARKELEIARAELAANVGKTEAEARLRGTDQATFAKKIEDLQSQNDKLQLEIASLRQLLLASRANQIDLKKRLQVTEQVEAGNAAYCDRLETRLQDLTGRLPKGRVVRSRRLL